VALRRRSARGCADRPRARLLGTSALEAQPARQRCATEVRRRVEAEGPAVRLPHLARLAHEGCGDAVGARRHPAVLAVEREVADRYVAAAERGVVRAAQVGIPGERRPRPGDELPADAVEQHGALLLPVFRRRRGRCGSPGARPSGSRRARRSDATPAAPRRSRGGRPRCRTRARGRPTSRPAWAWAISRSGRTPRR
jgi:hypothetical protein